MAIDTTGGMAAEAAAPAKASDIMDNLPEILGLTGEDGGEGEGEEDPSRLADGEGEAEDGGDDPAKGAEADAEADADGEGEGEQDEKEGDKGKEGDGEAPPKKLAAEFTVSDAEGELEIPDLTIKFKASGQERELPLDRVVKLAQQGFYNEEREAQVKEFRESLPQWQEAVATRDQAIQFYQSAWERVLAEGAEGSTETLEREIQNYINAQSPEARAQRAEADLQDLRNQGQQMQVMQQVQQFTNDLLPKFEALASQAPDVGQEAIIGKWNLLMAPLMVRGQVPPSRFREAARIIDAELIPWVESQQEAITAKRSTATEEQRRQSAIAADAKRRLSRVTRPQGGHAPEAPKPAAKIQAAADILSEDSLKEMVSGIGR